jgi:hypothetical protein
VQRKTPANNEEAAGSLLGAADCGVDDQGFQDGILSHGVVVGGVVLSSECLLVVDEARATSGVSPSSVDDVWTEARHIGERWAMLYGGDVILEDGVAGVVLREAARAW